MWLIVLDGPKGAGKTTTIRSFLELAPDTIVLSLDVERHSSQASGSLGERNKVAFEVIKEKLEVSLGKSNNVIIDCGLDDYRIKCLKAISQDFGLRPQLIFLTAPYEELLQRVQKRNMQDNKVFSKERFDEVYEIVHRKDLAQYKVFDTTKFSPSEIAGALLPRQ